MKKVLFIIPNTGIGGTVSSLNSIFRHYHDTLDISVMPLSTYVANDILDPSIRIVKSDTLIELYTSNFRLIHDRKKILAVFLKTVKRCLILLGIDLTDWLCRRTISIVERKQVFDIVIGFQEGIASLVASYSGAGKKIAWIHCNYDYYAKECHDEETMYSRFDNIVCVSRFTMEAFAGHFPQFRNRTSFIYNIFNNDAILAKSTLPIEDVKFDNSQFTIISIGRITDIKRFRLIPEIASEIKAAGLSFRWYILGGGDGNNEHSALSANIQNMAVKNEVVCLGAKNNPYPYIANANLLVCLSESEACPMIFNESKLLGIPIITTDFGSAYEFIDERKDGIICKLSNIPEAVIKHIKTEGKTLSRTSRADEFIRINDEIHKSLDILFN